MKFFTMRVGRHWNKSPKEAVDAPPPGTSDQGQAEGGFGQHHLVFAHGSKDELDGF